MTEYPESREKGLWNPKKQIYNNFVYPWLSSSEDCGKKKVNALEWMKEIYQVTSVENFSEMERPNILLV